MTQLEQIDACHDRRREIAVELEQARARVIALLQEDEQLFHKAFDLGNPPKDPAE